MNNKLYVGQLSFSVDSNTLGDFFSAAGQVTSAKVITDRDTGRSKGFGFVEMSTEAEAQKAINELNGQEISGRAINVSIAKPQEGGGRSGGGNKRFSGKRY